MPMPMVMPMVMSMTMMFSYDGIETLAASAPTAATGATYNYQSEMPTSSLSSMLPSITTIIKTPS